MTAILEVCAWFNCYPAWLEWWACLLGVWALAWGWNRWFLGSRQWS